MVREGFVSESRLWALMAACDIHVSLRSPTMGETSGTAIRALTLGKPLVVTDVGWFCELPEGVALKVSLGTDEIDDLAAALRLLAEQPDARAAMGAAARELATTEHDLRRVAERQAAVFERVAGGGAVADEVLREVSEAAAASASRPGHPRPRRSPDGSPRSTSVGERRAAIPAWAWLAGIVALSCALRLWLVRGMVAPFVFVDEAIYTELARSLADAGGYAVRETPVSGYSLLYPALIAPAYGAFDNLVDAYGAAKATNAVVMSLAAIPTYLLARRVTGMWLALLGAVIAVAVPSMAYTGTMTTESLFYPVALGFAVVLVRYLERPGYAWLAALVVALAVAFATRSQSLAFVPAIATAPLLLALVPLEPAALRPFAPLYVLGAAAALGLVVLQAVRGQSLSDLLGAYSIVGEGGYDVGTSCATGSGTSRS